MWQNLTNAFLGLALVIVAFLGLTGSTLVWTLGALGILVAILGFSGARSDSLKQHSISEAVA